MIPPLLETIQINKVRRDLEAAVLAEEAALVVGTARADAVEAGRSLSF